MSALWGDKIFSDYIRWRDLSRKSVAVQSISGLDVLMVSRYECSVVDGSVFRAKDILRWFSRQRPPDSIHEALVEFDI